MSVRDTDRGWANMRRVAQELRRAPVVAVGVQGAEAAEIRDEQGVITGAVLAGVHEFGRQDGSIPERSFIRSTVDSNKKQYETLLGRMLRLTLEGKLTAQRALGLMGQRVQSDIQRSIEDGLKPDLAESTKRKRRQGDGTGVFKPLLDTGQLKQSITYEVRE